MLDASEKDSIPDVKNVIIKIKEQLNANISQFFRFQDASAEQCLD